MGSEKTAAMSLPPFCTFNAPMWRKRTDPPVLCGGGGSPNVCGSGSAIDQSILPAAFQTLWDPGIPGGIPADNDPVHPASVWLPSGNPYGGYHAYVFTDALSAKALVDARDFVERDVRAALGIAFNPSAPARRFEHSMGQFGQLPPNILRRSSADTLAQPQSTDVRNRWIPLTER